MTLPYTAVLYDLDGTIADSAPAITASLAFTIEQLGLPVPPQAEMLAWVGPPLPQSFEVRLGLSGDRLVEAMRVYRAHYLAHGALDSPIFPGVRELMAAVHAAGLPTSTATSKPETPATRILETHDLLQYLDLVTGASDDEVRNTKADVVAEALRRLGERGVDLSRPVLIGDRHHDVEGAAVHGVPTIMAGWGYGDEAEHAGAVAVAATPADVAVLLGVPLRGAA
ncbi:MULTISPECIES: HAD hydrolase-like protein [Frigoribacterium]|jgi:phosphoglycolate phosphatase|uniref:HAD hydrolase-like protein n=1 Tax=Frigoribacterium TaxID=96492 RepID=UPI0006F8BF17|nr:MULTISPECIES: HAD hydrolase-like protein [Frigoribacterium]KQR44473.1 haloacid dehalogenase [Frigoribacterium sp. Leaf164]MBD8728320.1 HAD hydrolase-like protein [Frigoribacterium sp. CFBP 13707]NII52253.1 phosphoglycolate phosphatase [Frigoribacterium endophyticum]QNE43905.1 HAD hydrolase-like protein [Frigoribacterium sp. NBH87]